MVGERVNEQSKAASHAFVTSILSGEPDDRLFLAAQSMTEGREAKLYLHGAKSVPMVAMLARPIRHLAGLLTGHPEALAEHADSVAERVVVALATRELIPAKFHLLPLDEDRIEALLVMTASVDGDEFYLEPPDGTGVMVRPLPIRVPHAVVGEVAAALEIGESTWATVGAQQVLPKLNPATDAWTYDLKPAAWWGAYSRPGLGQIAPAVLGCDRLNGQVYLLPSGSNHALRRQAEVEGVVAGEEVLVLLVVAPDPSDVMQIHGGPAANNALSANPERLWDASVSPLSLDAIAMGAKALEAYVESAKAAGGGLEDIEPSLSGIFSLMVLSLECLTAQMWSGVVSRQHAEHTAEWVMQSLATLDPENGGKIVRQVAAWRDQGKDMAISGTITEQGTFRVVVNEVDSKGAKIHEGVLMPG